MFLPNLAQTAVNLTETNPRLQSKFFVAFSEALGLIQELGGSAKMSHSPIMPHQFCTPLSRVFSIVQMIAFASEEDSEINPQSPKCLIFAFSVVGFIRSNLAARR